MLIHCRIKETDRMHILGIPEGPRPDNSLINDIITKWSANGQSVLMPSASPLKHRLPTITMI